MCRFAGDDEEVEYIVLTGRPCRCRRPLAEIITNGTREWCACGCGYDAPYEGVAFDPLGGFPFK